MHTTVSKGRLAQSGAEVLVVPILLGKGLSGVPLRSEALRRAERLAKVQEFVGKTGQVLVLPPPEGHSGDMLVCIGVGEKRHAGFLDAVRTMGGIAVQTARKAGLRTIAIDFSAKEFVTAQGVEGVVTGAMLANYAFDAYKKQNSVKCVAEIDFLLADSRMTLALRKVVDRTLAVMEGVHIARDLVNVPAHDMHPERLAQAAQELAKNSGGTIAVQVLDRAACEKLGMGAYIAVAQGAERVPKFITLTYTPPRPTKKKVAIVGKGVTFDSGGLSLKPADSMMTMKCDMAGAAAVLGLFAILGKLRPRVQIKGYIAATENMPSGKAIRPGDVVRSLSGKTIEILNTDAEGRLTLADAMTYALREKPDVILDLATLTGACMVALGEEIAGLMSNDRALAKHVLQSAASAGEKLWEMPLEEAYKDQVQSDIADLRNIATTRYGGALTAGLFLQEFVEETPWAHLDIAGPAFAERPMGACLQKGATGYGVRTLWKWIESL